MLWVLIPHQFLWYIIHFIQPNHYLRSNLNSIFIAAIFNAKDVKFIGICRTFYQLIKNINELDNSGLEININGKKVNVYFSLGLILTFKR